jgi:hypothetical protein
MARKTARKPKAKSKARKTPKRAAKPRLLVPTEIKLPEGFTEHVTAALNTAVTDAVARVAAQQQPVKVELPKIELPPMPVHKDRPLIAHVGADQRYTKNIGNYESFVYGFSLSVPTPVDLTDDIEKPETRDKLRPKYVAVMDFLNGLLQEVGKEVDDARKLAKV